MKRGRGNKMPTKSATKPEAPRAKRVAQSGRAKRVSPPEQRGRQVIRLLKLLQALNGSRGMSAQQLRELVGDGCTIRTLYRDLAHLQDAGFALTNDEGLWSANPGARIHAPVDADELLALVLAEQALSAGGAVAFSAPLATLLSKLLSAASPTTRDYCQELRQTAVATAFAPNQDERVDMHARTIQRAIAMEHALSITYQAPGRQPEARTVEPYGTWMANGRPYLIAYCRKAKALRTFNLARIRASEVLDEAFDRDPSFDLEAFTALGLGVFHGSRQRITVRFSPEVAHLPRERSFHGSQTVEPQPDGSVIVHLEAAGLPEIAAWIASFGGKVRALEPPELVSAVRALFRRGLEAHGKDNDLR
ncbi:MAG: WYL domain-containing protein [Polyangiaceae bacterium]